ncbi:MAG: 5-(carboxyamino)imidazole ribonucleotide synthase [Planctomycetaceae bacterium]
MTFLPGSTIGMLGSGQLGRMFAFAAHQLGYRIVVYSPDRNSPAGQAANREISAAYDDADALRKFAKSVNVVTLEFENIPIPTVEVVEQFVPVRPGPHVLAVAQNRIREKSTLQRAGLPVPKFVAVQSADDITTFLQSETTNQRGVLKSAEAGYDGKGQTIAEGILDTADAWNRIGNASAIIEELVDFRCEVSVIGARGIDGQIECFGPVLNHHSNHILDVSIAPAMGLAASLNLEAIEITRSVLESLDVVGVLCVEFFVTSDGRLLINEIAPRPHNSGHLTIEAAVTSQFEQQVRAVCGLPLGSMEQIRPAAMANLLGDHLLPGPPAWERLLANPEIKLHLYGKDEARIGRKMGHLTSMADTPEDAQRIVRNARKSLVVTEATCAT